MPHPHLNWRPASRKPEAVANVRVCLALLRIYRGVPLPQDEADLPGLARCLWPVVRLFPSLFEQGLMTSAAVLAKRGQSRRYSQNDVEEQLRWWKQQFRANRRQLPSEPADD
jgi:hypothetical protein